MSYVCFADLLFSTDYQDVYRRIQIQGGKSPAALLAIYCAGRSGKNCIANTMVL